MANDSKKYVSLTRLSNFLDNIKTKYSQIGHKHTIADLTDYKVDTALSSTSNNPIANKTVDAEFDAIATAMGALDLAIDGKADASHAHDDRYYTESEIDAKLSDKADSSHSHSNYVPTSRTVNGKALSSNISLSASDVGALPSTTSIPDSLSDLSSDSTHRTVTDTEKATWNAKSNFSGNYNDLTNKPTIPSISGLATETYADTAATTAANKVKNDLLNGAGTAYDTLKELSDLINDNTDAIGALETVAAGKADKTHTHAIADVSGLQSALDGKAASSHGTHVSYSTTAPVMDGIASVGSASTVARSDHKHPTDTSRAAKTDLDSHTGNTTVHITSTERTNWNAAKTHADSAHAPSNAQANQNAFSNIKVGSTTIAADTTTDTLELVGSNVTITPDATNDKVTIAVADGSTSTAGILKLTNSTSSTSTTTAATPNSVKSAYDLANTAKTNAATAQTRADSAYTLAESKVDSLSDLGVTATATELNYVDGVTSNVQTQIDDIHTEIDAKMNAVNPSGVGSFNLNRKSGTTVGDYSFTEGYDTTASGHVSHAEGDTTTASGNFSHTEGARTTASGAWSHAEGYWSTASGQYSHAEGYSTIAASNGQHVQGKFNIEDNQNKYAHIVGNGSSSKRANIHTLDWDGNAWFEGDVYIGGTSQDDTTASKVVTEASISTHVSDAVANIENLAYISEEDAATSTNTINADTLGGYLPSNFALDARADDLQSQVNDLQTQINAQASIHKTLTIPANGWSTSAPYTYTVSVNGILETDTPHWGVVYSIDVEDAIAEKEAFAMVDDLDTTNGSIIFTCFEDKPEVDLTIHMEVNR